MKGKLFNQLADFLKSIGYENQVSSWDREDLSRMVIAYVPNPIGQTLEFVVNDLDVYRIYLTVNKVTIVHAFKGDRSFGYMDFSNKEEKINKNKFTPIMEFKPLFSGNITKVKELELILKLTGCPTKK
jgi:hypothetical protein